MSKKNNQTDNQNKSAYAHALAEKIIAVLHSKGAKDVKLLHVEKSTIIADYYIICGGTSSTHVKSLADEVERQMAKIDFPPTNCEGKASGSWILLDFSSVIVHIFSRDTREFYNLEKLWNESEDIDISSTATR